MFHSKKKSEISYDVGLVLTGRRSSSAGRDLRLHRPRRKVWCECDANLGRVQELPRVSDCASGKAMTELEKSTVKQTHNVFKNQMVPRKTKALFDESQVGLRDHEAR